MDRDTLISYALMYQGDYRKIYQAVREHQQAKKTEKKPDAITFLDEDYPLCFMRLKYPPLVLFYKGRRELLQKDMIAVVGSRQSSSYGEQTTLRICSLLKKQAVLVSGMAKGIDSVVHKSALYDGDTIGVLGCGIDAIYPKENAALYREMEKRQLLISEYPGHVKPLRSHFPFRNRLIAALGEFVIVTEASEKSGTFLTVNEALELNKDVYVVPYPLEENNSGCNRLIQEGAMILCDYQDVLALNKRFDKA